MYENKSYLDFFLENSYKPKKREKYFTDKEEAAIIKYNSEVLSEREKNKLFQEIILPCFQKTISGVLEMPRFHHINYIKIINRSELIEATFERLLQKIHKFTPDLIGKNGVKVKAFSYFTVITRNFITEYVEKIKRVIENKADVESSIDLSILSEENLINVSSESIFYELEIDDASIFFNEEKKKIIEIVMNTISEEEKKEKPDQDLIKIGYFIKYIISKWDKIQFTKKNEFMRILTLFSGMPQQKVSLLFKKFKIDVLKEINPSVLKNIQRRVRRNFEKELEEIEELEFMEGNENFDEMKDFFEKEDYLEIDKIKPIKIKNSREYVVLTEIEKIQQMEINSVEEFELQQLKYENLSFKEKNKK